MSTIEEQEYRKSLCLHGIPSGQGRVCELEGQLVKVREALGLPADLERVDVVVADQAQRLRLVEAEMLRLREENKIARGQLNAFTCQQNEYLASVRRSLGAGSDLEFRDLVEIIGFRVESLRLADAEVERLTVENVCLSSAIKNWERSATTRAEADADLG